MLAAATGEFQFESDRFLASAFSPDGKLLAAGGREKTVVLLPTDTWQVGEGPARVLDECIGLAFSRDGRKLAVLGRRGRPAMSTTVIYDVKSRAMVARLTTCFPMGARLAFTPDGKRLLCATADGTLRILDVVGQGEPTVLVSPENAMSCLAVSPDGTRVVAGGDSGVVLVRDTASGKVLQQFAVEHPPVLCLTFLDRGATVLTIDRDQASFWDASAGKLKTSRRPHPGGFYAAAISGDGSLLASYGNDSGPRYTHFAVFACPAMTPVFSVYRDKAIHDMAISPDNAVVAVAGQSSDEIALCSVKTGEVQGKVHGYRYKPGGLAFSPDGKLLVVGSSKQGRRSATYPVTVYDAKTGDLVSEYAEHKAYVTSVVFSPDSQLVASSDGKGGGRVCRARTGEVVRRFQLEPAVARPWPGRASAAPASLDRPKREPRVYPYSGSVTT